MKIAFTLLLISITFLASAQSVEREVVSANGEFYSNSAGQLSTTLGEPIISTVSNGTNTLTQGFQQTKITVTGVNDYQLNVKMSVFPNPVANTITIKFEDLKENLFFTILTIEGKQLVTKKINKASTIFNMSQFARGAYLLNILENNQKIKTFQIIKQ